MLEDVRRRLGDGERHPSGGLLVEVERARQVTRAPACRRDVAGVLDGHGDRVPHRRGAGAHVHRVIRTVVPAPGCEWISNSLDSRLAPPRPSPSPLPVVKPSFSACSVLAIPAPWSANVRRRPRRLGSSRLSSSTVPPPP